ncbi:MAG TPA: hypothetical protein VEW08_04370 [Steroidobacteraceae bacterium]|nr:hypothetical protein [Steroidobacteraceae bacterium]
MTCTGEMRWMPKHGRLLQALVLILVVSIGILSTSRAEPIACLAGQKGCWELVIETKVRTSFDRAAYVFVGQLEAVQDSKSGGSDTRIFTFRIGKQYKDSLVGNVARISIDSYLTGGKTAGAHPQKSLDEFEQLEAAAESIDTEEAKNQYEQRVMLLRDEIKKNGSAESAPTHVVHLDLMLGDVPIRNTDIPMRIGERYAVFVLSKAALAPEPDKDTGSLKTWIGDPVDLYSMNDDRGARALAALEQASKSKPLN